VTSTISALPPPDLVSFVSELGLLNRVVGNTPELALYGQSWSKNYLARVSKYLRFEDQAKANC
jgi:hypothetical protein